VTGGQIVGEQRIAQDFASAQLVSAGRDLDVVRDRIDDRGDLQRREVLADLFPDRADELLLARVSVQVVVGVAEADEVECLLTAQELVAGLQVDIRVVVVGGPSVLVVVTAVDVHPDTAELVDDFLEAVEVDGDQIVDRQPGEVTHRQQRSLDVAASIGRVDPVDAARRGTAVDWHLEVAREREHRDRLVDRICTHEHHRVRA
jgi:hypothetical protein